MRAACLDGPLLKENEKETALNLLFVCTTALVKVCYLRGQGT